MTDIFPLIEHIRPGDCFHIYHRKDTVWTASITTYRYAKRTIIIKGSGSTPEEAILRLHAECIRKANSPSVTFTPGRTHPTTTP